MWDTPPAISRSLRCSATFLLAIILKKRQLPTPGTWLSRYTPLIRKKFGSPFTRMTTRHLPSGKNTSPPTGLSVLEKRKIFGQWATPVPAALAPSSFMTGEKNMVLPAVQKKIFRASGISNSGISSLCSFLKTPLGKWSPCLENRSTPDRA